MGVKKGLLGMPQKRLPEKFSQKFPLTFALFQLKIRTFWPFGPQKTLPQSQTSPYRPETT
jgi:hypothetical protein